MPSGCPVVGWLQAKRKERGSHMTEGIFGWMATGMGMWTVLAILVVLAVVYKSLSRK